MVESQALSLLIEVNFILLNFPHEILLYRIGWYKRTASGDPGGKCLAKNFGIGQYIGKRKTSISRSGLFVVTL